MLTSERLLQLPNSEGILVSQIAGKAFSLLSIFKEDNVFSMTANLPYDPPVNTDIDYNETFL